MTRATCCLFLSIWVATCLTTLNLLIAVSPLAYSDWNWQNGLYPWNHEAFVDSDVLRLSMNLPDNSDSDISAMADTRTSRAFMLLGRCAGTFD